MKGLIGFMAMAVLLVAAGELDEEDKNARTWSHRQQEQTPSWLRSQASSEHQWDARDWAESGRLLLAGGNQVSARRSFQTAHRLNKTMWTRSHTLRVTFALMWGEIGHDRILRLIHSIALDSVGLSTSQSPRIAVFTNTTCPRRMKEELMLWRSVELHHVQPGTQLSPADGTTNSTAQILLRLCLRLFGSCVVLPPDVVAVDRKDVETSVVDQIRSLVRENLVFLHPARCFAQDDRNPLVACSDKIIGAASLAALDNYLSSELSAQKVQTCNRNCLFKQQETVNALCGQLPVMPSKTPVVMVWPIESHFRLPRSPAHDCRVPCLFVPPLPAFLGIANAVMIHVPSLDSSKPELPPLKCQEQQWIHFSQESDSNYPLQTVSSQKARSNPAHTIQVASFRRLFEINMTYELRSDVPITYADRPFLSGASSFH
eukprot:115187-Hanusia_phi.AAC.4